MRRMSLPMCGLFSQRISSGAPKRANVSSTSRLRGSFVCVFSFPSENVPAPPSPNWMLHSSSRTLDLKKCSQDKTRSSTVPPLSTNTGRMPPRSRRKAQKSPAGPLPTTTTRRGCLATCGIFFSSLGGADLSASTEYSQRMSALFLASRDFFKIRTYLHPGTF